MDGHQVDERPLSGPGGRIPVVDAGLAAPAGIAAVRAGWTVRHTLLAAAAAPVMFGVYRGAAGGAAVGWGWYLVLAAAGLLAGVLVAFYLPLRGQPREKLGPCFVMPVAMMLAAGVLFAPGVTPFTATVALVLLAFGVLRRATSLNTC
ncbi:MAG: hypothetical protein VB080_04260 [Propionicimonas sp.]|uniref:hypothetical protein n=1 Tax=Propionicimonas sp. TaxID=1955623 RepID=UPI002B21574B|nr:hypothetical protein [Propionicimonas sp.]MEA4943634.1 hypothetical protein [Propionicimonas sp.]MEA5054064.1 hypothetical protein [Propionicimonas sp.]MEA5117620.1 hypothetical protein [Propionicimonas sp.]